MVFFGGAFEYGSGGTFRLMRWMRNMHLSLCLFLIYLYLEFIAWAKESRLRVQSFNATC
jgi:hypothetical protein